MIDPNAVSRVMRGLRGYLAEALGMPVAQILIAHPQSAAEQSDHGPGLQHLGLFLYRAEIDGFPADGTYPDPVYLRLHCLLTPFSVDETDDEGTAISAGENDLRLLGGVMSALHRNPVLVVGDDDGEVQLQVVPVNLDVEEINNLWSTQTDVAYRPSVAYELALAPLPMAQPPDDRRRVGRIGLGVAPGIGESAAAIAATSATPMESGPLHLAVDTDGGSWRPLIAAAGADGAPIVAVTRTTDDLPLTLEVLVAGQAQPVSLFWEVWSAEAGWQPQEGAAATLTPGITRLAVSLFADHALSLPVPLSGAGQASLHARRDDTGRRSDPLLVTVYERDGA